MADLHISLEAPADDRKWRREKYRLNKPKSDLVQIGAVTKAEEEKVAV